MFTASLAVTIMVTVLFMFALRPVAIGINLVDRPGGRKEHVGNVPIIGGISMFLGLFAGLLMVPDLAPEYLYLFAASLLLVSVGLIDDKYGIPASVRMIAQLSAVLMIVYGGNMAMHDIGDPLFLGTILLGPFSLIASALVFMTVINAFNLIDGLDGLAGSLALIAFLAIAATSGAGSATGVVACISASAVLGYLLFNLPLGHKRTYRAFMGDSGSTFLGLVIVWLTVSISQGAEREISPVTGLWFAALPIFDLLTCFVSRIARRESPLTSGRDHFHHVLGRSEMNVRQVLGVLVLIQLFYAGIGIGGHLSGVPESVMFTLWAMAGLSQHSVIKFVGKYHLHVKRGRGVVG